MEAVKVSDAGLGAVHLKVAPIACRPRGLIVSPVKAAKAWLGHAINRR
jgi:hypothetical protein